MAAKVKLLTTSDLEMLCLDPTMVDQVIEVSDADNCGYPSIHWAVYMIDLAWGATDPSKRVWYRVTVEPRSSTTAKVTVTSTTREATGAENLGEFNVDYTEDALNSEALMQALREYIRPHMHTQTP